jgi:MYXO-CTERM domain-containing protein
VNLAGANNELRFTTLTQPPVAMAPSSNPNGAELGILRLTVQSTTHLGGFNDTVEVGLAGGQVVTVHVFPPPAPGATALFGIGAIVGGRRRRAH